jgi:ferritin-like metal-binding protein YciE
VKRAWARHPDYRQRVEHYEIAAYGTEIAHARLLEHDEVVGLLEESLEEEKACAPVHEGSCSAETPACSR